MAETGLPARHAASKEPLLTPEAMLAADARAAAPPAPLLPVRLDLVSRWRQWWLPSVLSWHSDRLLHWIDRCTTTRIRARQPTVDDAVGALASAVNSADVVARRSAYVPRLPGTDGMAHARDTVALTLATAAAAYAAAGAYTEEDVGSLYQLCEDADDAVFAAETTHAVAAANEARARW